MSTERLSPLDASFLQIETDAAHMHVGWTLVFDGDPPSVEALRRHVDSRLDAVPGFRRCVVADPLGVLDPVWADDPRFDVANHVHELAISAPGTPAQLRALAGDLLSRRLDRGRPLWNLYLIRGLERGRFAIVGQAHHTLVDGVAAMEVGVLLLDPDPGGEAGPPPDWRPEPPPGVAALAQTTAVERARRALVALTAITRAARAPGRLAAAAGQARDAAGALLSTAYPPAPNTSLNVQLGPGRSVAFADLSLEDARSIGAPYGATVNDVVVAIAGMALRGHLRRSGDRCEHLRVMVPVNVRARGTARELGNRISFMFLELPLDAVDPAEMLAAVRDQTRARKDAHTAHDLQVALDAAAWLPAPARRMIARMSARPESFHTVVSNIPGPQQPLFLLGRPLLKAYPAVPLADGHALSVGVLSYDGRLHAGIYADRAAVPDVDDLPRAMAAAFDSLRLSARRRRPEPDRPPTPWRRRARERRAELAGRST